MPSTWVRYTTAKGKSVTKTRRVFLVAGTREREGKDPDNSLFDRSRKADAKAGFFFVVVDYLCHELTPGGGNEPGMFHRDVRRASANTSSAA